MSTTTTRVAIPSARANPAIITATPATAVAMNPNRSVGTCWNAPSTLRLSRFARLIATVAPRFTATPAKAVTSTATPLTSGGATRRRAAS
jgi:hypothetical protein